MSATSCTGVLLFYAVGLRAARILYTQRALRLKHIWWPIFAEAISNEAYAQIDEVPIAGSSEKTEILREWNRFYSAVRGGATARLQLLAKRLGLLEAARLRLKRKAVSSKLLAITALGHLGDSDSWPAIEMLLDHPNVAVSVTAAAALVDIDPERAMPQILPLISMRARWPRTRVGRFLNVAGPEVISQPLCAAIEAAPAGRAIRLLLFAESADMAEVNRLVERLLASRQEPDLMAAALKAARGHIRTSAIEPLTVHDVWYVRMQAASLLGRAGRAEDCRILEPLLNDAQWWVRYRAAQAIVKLTPLGPNALRRLRERQHDRFARDVLNHVLAEKGLA